jgi:hypothetical protein
MKPSTDTCRAAIIFLKYINSSVLAWELFPVHGFAVALIGDRRGYRVGAVLSFS